MQQALRQAGRFGVCSNAVEALQSSCQALRSKTLSRRAALLVVQSSENGDSNSSDHTIPRHEKSSEQLWRDDSPRKRSRSSKTHGSSRNLRLKPSKKLRTHPSKAREKAWQLEHDRKTKSWNASTTSVEASMIEHPEQYFDEKWVHTQGRLSDWPPPEAEDERKSAQTSGRRNNRHRTHEIDSHQEGNSAIEDPPSPSTSVLKATTNLQSEMNTGSRWRFFATCHPGLEQPLANELKGPMIRAQDVSPGQSGVTFWGPSIETGYRACMWLRGAIRVLVLLASSPIDCTRPSGEALYEWAREAVDWPALIQKGQTFSIDARVTHCSTVPSSMLVKIRLKDAIADVVRDRRMEKLNPPEDSIGDIPLFAVLYKDNIHLYRDMAGRSLHRRGYRSAMHVASLNESAAAGLLGLASWPKENAVLADPMCGCGTFLIEAALMAQNRPPAFRRTDWPFKQWVDKDSKAWRSVREEAYQCQHQVAKTSCTFLANDKHGGALALAKRDAEAAGVADLIQFSQGFCDVWRPPKPDLTITNPPWGMRLPEVEYHIDNQASTEVSDTEVVRSSTKSWDQLATFLKTSCRDSDAYILTGNADLASALYMKTSKRHPVTLGGVNCKFLHYKILPPRTSNW